MTPPIHVHVSPNADAPIYRQRGRPLARRLGVEADGAGRDAHALAALIEEEARALENERASRGDAS